MARARLQPLYLSIDFGTSHVRAAVGHATGPPLAIARTPLRYFQPEDGPDTALEIDTGAAWRAISATSRRAIKESGLDSRHILGVGVTSQRLGLVMYGNNGKELYAGPNRDMRGVFQGGQIDADAGGMLWQMTGHGPGMLTAWSRLLWFKEERPDVYRQLRAVSGLADWLAYRMTGVLLMESALACDAGLGLVATGASAEGLATYAGVDEVMLPPTCQSGTVVGKMVTPAARQLGVKAGIPVVVAGPDSQVGLLGMGIHEPDEAGVVAGWSAVVQRVTRMPLFDGTRSVWTGRHVFPDRWIVEGNAGEMGGAYQWLVQMLCQGEDQFKAMERLDRQALSVPAGAEGSAAYLGPSFTNISVTGLRPGGLLFPVPLSFEPPDRAKLARAALESFAFAIRFNADRLASYGGPARAFAIGGGMTRSRTFRQVVTAALGGAASFAVGGETTTLGALSITAAAVEDREIAELAGRRRRELRVLTVEGSAVVEYEDLYHAWRARERQLLDMEL